jgi:WD40 repeat protein
MACCNIDDSKLEELLRNIKLEEDILDQQSSSSLVANSLESSNIKNSVSHSHHFQNDDESKTSTSSHIPLVFIDLPLDMKHILNQWKREDVKYDHNCGVDNGKTQKDDSKGQQMAMVDENEMVEIDDDMFDQEMSEFFKTSNNQSSSSDTPATTSSLVDTFPNKQKINRQSNDIPSSSKRLLLEPIPSHIRKLYLVNFQKMWLSDPATWCQDKYLFQNKQMYSETTPPPQNKMDHHPSVYSISLQSLENQNQVVDKTMNHNGSLLARSFRNGTLEVLRIEGDHVYSFALIDVKDEVITKLKFFNGVNHLLLCGSICGNISIYSLPDQAKVIQLKHPFPNCRNPCVSSIDCEIREQYVAAGYDNGQVCLWSIKNQVQLLKTFHENNMNNCNSIIHQVMIHPSYRYILYSQENTIYMCEIESKTVVRQFKHSLANYIRFCISFDGTFLAGVDFFGQLELWNIEKNRLMHHQENNKNNNNNNKDLYDIFWAHYDTIMIRLNTRTMQYTCYDLAHGLIHCLELTNNHQQNENNISQEDKVIDNATHHYCGGLFSSTNVFVLFD